MCKRGWGGGVWQNAGRTSMCQRASWERAVNVNRATPVSAIPPSWWFSCRDCHDWPPPIRRKCGFFVFLVCLFLWIIRPPRYVPRSEQHLKYFFPLFSTNLLYYLGVQIQIQLQLPGRTAGSYLPFWSWPKNRGMKDKIKAYKKKLWLTSRELLAWKSYWAAASRTSLSERKNY